MSAALDRLKAAVADAGDAPLALTTTTAGDVVAVLKTIPAEALAARIDPNPTGEVWEFVPQHLLDGASRCHPAATVHQYARQVAAALALVPS